MKAYVGMLYGGEWAVTGGTASIGIAKVTMRSAIATAIALFVENFIFLKIFMFFSPCSVSKCFRSFPI
jgi:hypothetical protein